MVGRASLGRDRLHDSHCQRRVLEKQATSCRRKRARLIRYCEELRFAKMPGERSVAVPLQAVLEDQDALRKFATLIESPIPSPGLKRTGHDSILEKTLTCPHNVCSDRNGYGYREKPMAIRHAVEVHNVVPMKHA